MADNPQLVVAITARLDQFEKQMREAGLIAEREVKNIERKISRGSAIGSFGGNLAAELVKGLAGGLKQLPDLIKSVGDIGDVAERIFISTDALQALRFAVEQTGGSASAADAAMAKFAQTIGKSGDASSYLAKVFAANNVSLKESNGNFKTQEQLLGEFAVMVSKAATEQDKLRLATEAFGRTAGPQMLKVLDDIARRGMPGFNQAAKDAGAVINENLIKQADELEKKWQAVLTRLTTMLKAFAVGVVAAVDAAAKRSEESGGAHLSALFGKTSAQMAQARKEAQEAKELREERDRELRRGLAFTELTRTPTVVPVKGVKEVSIKDKKTDLQRFDEQLSKHNELLRAELETTGQSVGQQEKARQVALLAEAARRQGLTIEQALTAERQKQINQAGDLRQGEIERAEAMRELVSASKDFGSGLADAFKGLTLEGKKLDEVIKSLTDRMASKAIDKLFDMMFASSAGGSATTPFLDLLKGLQGRQAGGPVSGGTPYMVGERGPELFVPSRGGMIVPNSATKGGGSASIKQTVVVNDYSGQAKVRQTNTAEGGGVEVFVPAIEQMLAVGVSRGRGALSKSMDARSRGTNLYG